MIQNNQINELNVFVLDFISNSIPITSIAMKFLLSKGMKIVIRLEKISNLFEFN
jgi:hypothetical protein